MNLAQAFKIVSHKGCVSLPGPEATAHKAMLILEPYLTERERLQLIVAKSHASMNEGRGEWDSVCKKIGERLGLKS